MAENGRSESGDAVFKNGLERPTRTPAWPFRTRLGPLSLTPKRVRLIWFALTVIALLPILSAPYNKWGDWSAFWSAGGTVGTANLMDSHLHMAWQTAHGLPGDAWRYAPSFAYLFWPASLLPIGLSFAINAALMLSLVVVAGRLLSRIFDLPWDLTVRLAFAWTPILAAVDMGQNAPLSVVLALWSIDALRRGSRTEAGLAVGLLMYKPTLGLPLLGFLLLRRCWRSALVASLVVAAGYVLSVPAAAGDWQWPVAWWNGMQPLIAHDLAFNADKAISIPGLLGRVSGLPYWLPFACGGVVALVALRGLARAPMVEAASAACLVGLVAGPRVWSYEAGLMLPLLAWAVAGGVAEPWRTRLVFLAISMGILWWISPLTVVSGVAVVVIAATLLWLWRWRPFGPDPSAGEAPPGAPPPATAPGRGG